MVTVRWSSSKVACQASFCLQHKVLAAPKEKGAASLAGSGLAGAGLAEAGAPV